MSIRCQTSCNWIWAIRWVTVCYHINSSVYLYNSCFIWWSKHNLDDSINANTICVRHNRISQLQDNAACWGGCMLYRSLHALYVSDCSLYFRMLMLLSMLHSTWRLILRHCKWLLFLCSCLEESAHMLWVIPLIISLISGLCLYPVYCYEDQL